MNQLICAHCGAAFECARKKKYCGTTECNVSRQRAYQAKSDAKKRAAAGVALDGDGLSSRPADAYIYPK